MTGGGEGAPGLDGRRRWSSRFAAGGVFGTTFLLAACGALIGVTDPTLSDGADEGDAGGGKTDAGSCEANLRDDKENCGECGHSCGGRACQDGVCASADGFGEITQIVVDADNYYVSQTDGVYRYDRKSGNVQAPGILLVKGAGAALSIDATYLYLVHREPQDSFVGAVCKLPCNAPSQLKSVKRAKFSDWTFTSIVPAQGFVQPPSDSTGLPAVIVGTKDTNGQFWPLIDELDRSNYVPSANLASGAQATLEDSPTHKLRAAGKRLCWTSTDVSKPFQCMSNNSGTFSMEICGWSSSVVGFLNDFASLDDSRFIAIDGSSKAVRGVTVIRDSVSGCTLSKDASLFESTGADLRQIELDGETFYVRSDHAIRRCTWAGCDASPVAKFENATIASMAITEDGIHYAVVGNKVGSIHDVAKAETAESSMQAPR